MTVHVPPDAHAYTAFLSTCDRLGLSPVSAELLLAIPADGEPLYQYPSAGHLDLMRRGLVDATGPTHDRSGYVALTDLGRMARLQLAQAPG